MSPSQTSTQPLGILAFAKEAGGAAAIAPALYELTARNHRVVVWGRRESLPVFASHGLEHEDLGEADAVARARRLFERRPPDILPGSLPDILVTSCCSPPSIDMSERLLWRWARQAGIPSLAVLDHWQNYALRFSGLGGSDHERLAYLPDRCCVPDEAARFGMLQEGFPEERILVAGQPAFDALVDRARGFKEAQRQELLARLGLAADKPLVLFVMEALARFEEVRLGYDEAITLDYLLETLADMDRPPSLVVKRHPQNTDADLRRSRLEEFTRRLDIRDVAHDPDINSLCLAADLVVGMQSIALVQAILLGRPTVSLQLDAAPGQSAQCPPVVAGALPFVTDRREAKGMIVSLLADNGFRERWLSRQSVMRHRPGATGRVAAAVEDLARRRNLQPT